MKNIFRLLIVLFLSIPFAIVLGMAFLFDCMRIGLSDLKKSNFK